MVWWQMQQLNNTTHNKYDHSVVCHRPCTEHIKILWCLWHTPACMCGSHHCWSDVPVLHGTLRTWNTGNTMIIKKMVWGRYGTMLPVIRRGRDQRCPSRCDRARPEKCVQPLAKILYILNYLHWPQHRAAWSPRLCPSRPSLHQMLQLLPHRSW